MSNPMTAIPAEIQRFDKLSSTWWNKLGPMRPLHVVNALRLEYVIAQVAQHFGRMPTNALYGLRILDVGCGGGLLSEPLARLGAVVVGVDASQGNVSAARSHASLHGVPVDYRLGESADVVSSAEQFDVVMALEVVEHVKDMPAFMADAARHLAPGGMMFVSTIDRTWKSYVFAIVGAEYILKLLPRGTHHWSMFVRPEELNSALAPHGLVRQDLRGMRYQPLHHRASWISDTRVNYIATFAHSEKMSLDSTAKAS
jgi:2-polyprenyl-6-hydroxyphenyl methylase/3-demethylubiquinone-9 3-methyltransferase